MGTAYAAGFTEEEEDEDEESATEEVDGVGESWFAGGVEEAFGFAAQIRRKIGALASDSRITKYALLIYVY
ncbi:hypothetical protein HK104_003881 [Borealophlyctis nickersoniae]|nr:hypothetical protein HK104_003881 [Borealophlyctis nickersoniae]